MIFAKIRQNKGNYTESLVCAESDLKRLDNLLDIDILYMLPFKISGKTYSERQNSLRDLAIEFQYNNDGETDIQLSCSEIGYICNYFEKYGRKYGLLSEFRENCIC